MSGKRIQLTRGVKAMSPRAKGLIVLAVLLAFALFSFNRPRVMTTLTPGDGLKAEFSSGYKLVPYESNVKIAGVKVGVVTGFERTADDHTVVDMKLDKGTREKLGTAPSANVRPTLLLGGTYYVELVPGGAIGAVAAGTTIPVDRTSVPVELDKVLSTVTPDASEAVKGTIHSLGKTLRTGGRHQAQRLLDHAPRTLGPASKVLESLRGTHPQQDLSRLVSGLQNTAAALTRHDGQLGSIIDGLDTTTATLARSRTPLAQTIGEGPETLRVTRAGLADLAGTLDQLRTTASSFGPSARALDRVLGKLGPVLKQARPVIADARVVTRDARPLVEDLVPTSRTATDVLDDFSGPVLKRLNGPITAAVMSPWHGTGKYEGGGNDHLFYEETGYFFSHTADVFKFHDKNGAMGRLMAGVGLSTPGGVVSKSLEEYLEMLGLQQPLGPQENAHGGGSGSTPAVPSTSLSGSDNQGIMGLLDLVSGVL